MTLKRLLCLAVAALAAVPVAAFALVKPLRVVAPTLVPGIICIKDTLCTDDAAHFDAARTLYREGYAMARNAVGPFRDAPRVVFCSTAACAQAFGIGAQAAQTVGDFGVIVAPRGWKPFYLAHELIHYRQAEVLGNLAVATRPKWLIEGMAYSLSGDPRHPLTEPFEQWRAQFDAWHAGIGAQNIWAAARNVH
ncbi:hypothetical protein [Paraburkholderia bannensis]|uniref:hypothetical protein n=1 Tax=Paraburkholderia bannensis TaxID=765414 RepID=UPI002AB70985|nr:hypothetical protein [Paraburkholderia bannensis]